MKPNPTAATTAPKPDPPAADPFGRFVVEFDPPGDVPAVNRVRSMLKAALRQWRLRARVIRDPRPDELEAKP